MSIASNWQTIRNANFTRVDSFLPIPGYEGQFYVFRGPQYIRIILDIGNLGDTLHHQGPYDIAEQWSSIRSAGFTVVDAAVAAPGRPNEAYIFSGSKYIRIHIDPYSLSDSIVVGPHEIADKWPSLVTSEFTTIDAALPVPGRPDQIYFFRGAKYVRVIMDLQSLSDTIHNRGPYKIEELWPSIAQAGFTCVDACTPVPGRPNEAYIFCGTGYIRIKLDPSTLVDARVY